MHYKDHIVEGAVPVGSRVPLLAQHQHLPRLSSNKVVVLGHRPVLKNVGQMGLSVNPVLLRKDSEILSKSLSCYKLQVVSCKMETVYPRHSCYSENAAGCMLCDRVSTMRGM